MLTNQVPSTKVFIPHEPGEWVELRLMSHKDLAAARESAQQAQYDNIRKMGDVFGSVMAGESRLTPEQQEARRNANPLQAYDIDDLLERGIVDWSYGQPVTPDNRNALDEKTAKYLSLVLIGAQETAEATAKNGSNGSSASTSPLTDGIATTEPSSQMSGSSAD